MKNIATEFGFEETALQEHLECAQGMHDNATRQSSTHKQLLAFAKAAEKLSAQYESLPDPAQWLLGDICALQKQVTQAVADSQLITGRGRATQLLALHVYTAQIKDFWTHHRNGERFGCLFEDGQPANDASRFLWACVQWLDYGYTTTNVESCMRKVQEGEPPVREPLPEESDDMTADEIDVALRLFTRRPRN